VTTSDGAESFPSKAPCGFVPSIVVAAVLRSRRCAAGRAAGVQTGAHPGLTLARRDLKISMPLRFSQQKPKKIPRLPFLESGEAVIQTIDLLNLNVNELM
jgi:hypothetical protein